MKKEMKEKKYIFFFKQKTAYEMRISDWSSDACSSDLIVRQIGAAHRVRRQAGRRVGYPQLFDPRVAAMTVVRVGFGHDAPVAFNRIDDARHSHAAAMRQHLVFLPANEQGERSEEHTSELQSLMRNTYAVFCLTTKMNTRTNAKQVQTITR